MRSRRPRSARPSNLGADHRRQQQGRGWTRDADALSPATRYRIFRGTSSPVSTATELNARDRHWRRPHYTFTDTTATNGQTYFYVVQAWYSDGTGSGSTNSTTQSISTPQNAVTNLDAALDIDGVHVSWLGVDANATSVEVDPVWH